jgi:hypothetical protein
VSASRFFDHTDYVSARVPKRRKVDLEFDRVVSMKESFSFFIGGNFICKSRSISLKQSLNRSIISSCEREVCFVRGGAFRGFSFHSTPV